MAGAALGACSLDREGGNWRGGSARKTGRDRPDPKASKSGPSSKTVREDTG